jgi:DNA-binding LacI/PurR family transcriptional regulator
VGFDDIPEAQYFTPPLTTVRQDFGEMGRSALRLMLDVMRGAGEATARLTVAPELVVRRSTGPPA